MKTEIHHDSTRNDYVSCEVMQGLIFFSVKHDSQVTLFKSDATAASSVLLLNGQSIYLGQ